jgi:Fic family protein
MIGLNAIAITPDILRLISQIDEFKGLWSGLERHTTGLSMLGDVASYGQAFHKTLLGLKAQKIDVDMIRILHASLHAAKVPSEFRTGDHVMAIVKDGAVVGSLETAEAEDIAPLLGKLLAWAEEALEADQVIHPLLVIAVFSSVFLQICPFADNNQKLLRMLIIVYMLKAGYAYVPYVQIDALMNDRAELIYSALAHNQASLEGGAPDWSRWLHCFLSLLHGQKDVLHSRLLSKEKDLSHLPTLSARIMALFEDHQRLQMKEIIKLTNGRRATIKVRLNELVEGEYLVRHGAGRSTWYALV